MGFPTWTLWGMGLSAFGALVAIALAFLAQSPRLLTRLKLNGQRIDLRAKSFTGYGLALLLLALGFFVAGVPLDGGEGAAVAEASSEVPISVLAPGPGRSFTTDDTIDFDWFWPTLPADSQRFVVYLSDGARDYALGSLDEPNNGVAYRLSVAGRELPAAGEGLTWHVRLEAADGETIAATEAIPLTVAFAEATPGANGGQSGAMVGLEVTAELTATTPITGGLALPPGAVAGTPTAEAVTAATPLPEATEPPTATPSPIPSATPTPTPAPTLTPTPILGPTARVGDETSTLPLRRLPGGPVLVVLVRGDIVLPLSGHAFYDGDVWREISTVEGMIGWVPDEFLVYQTDEE